jgi:hypothetical protein
MQLLASQPFQHVHLHGYETLFWRHQPMGASCVSTVEAVYYLLREYAVETERRRRLQALAGADAAGRRAELEAVPGHDPHNVFYDGSFDPLTVLFMANYKLIQHEYTEGEAVAGRWIAARNYYIYVAGSKAKAGKQITRKMRPGYIKGAAATAECGGASDTDEASDAAAAGDGSDAPAGREKDVQPAKRRIVRGGWAVRTDVMDAGASVAACGPFPTFFLRAHSYR